MNPPAPTVFVVDDDDSVRRSLARLLKSAGYHTESFASATGFLAHGRLHACPACLVLDLRMPGLTGLDLQARLREQRSPLALVFITGHGDVPTSVRAMKHGAVDFLLKPFDDVQFLDAVARALDRNRRDHAAQQTLASLQARYQTLTPREREVMAALVTGKRNKEIAQALGTVEKTIKVHRARLLHKMQTHSVVELVPLAQQLGLLPPP